MTTSTTSRRVSSPSKTPTNDEARRYQQLRAHLDYRVHEGEPDEPR